MQRKEPISFVARGTHWQEIGRKTNPPLKTPDLLGF
jgi:hypothetical protein